LIIDEIGFKLLSGLDITGSWDMKRRHRVARAYKGRSEVFQATRVRWAIACALSALLLSFSAASLLTIGVDTASASSPRSTNVTPAAGGTCEWENTGASPRLYIRSQPNTNSSEVGFISYHEKFFGSCDLINGFIETNDPITGAPGYANAHYCTLISASARTPAVVRLRVAVHAK
jgi:hypothetical protein